MNKNILVTGAAGFIGSFLCEELISNQYHVIGIDNFFRGKRENLLSVKDNNRFRFFEIDLSDQNNIAEIKKCIHEYQIDTIMHFAAINGTQYFYERPLFVLDQNIRITQNILHATTDSLVKTIFYASSSEVYGNPSVFPTSESNPISLYESYNRDSYALSKAAGEFYVRLFSQKSNISWLNLRIFNTYGERMVGTQYGQVIPEFINRMLFEKTFTILGDGKQTRSFCYVKDLTRMIRELMEKKITGLTNIGNDDEISILNLAEKIHSISQHDFNPVFSPGRPNDHQRRRPDLTHLKSLIGEPAFTWLDSGLKKTIDFYKKPL